MRGYLITRVHEEYLLAIQGRLWIDGKVDPGLSVVWFLAFVRKAVDDKYKSLSFNSEYR